MRRSAAWILALALAAQGVPFKALAEGLAVSGEARTGGLSGAAGASSAGAVNSLRSSNLSLTSGLSATAASFSNASLSAVRAEQGVSLPAAVPAASAISPAVAADPPLQASAPSPLVQSGYAAVEAFREGAPALAAFSGSNGDLKAASNQSNRLFDLRARKSPAGQVSDSAVAAGGLTLNPSGEIDPFYPGRENFAGTSNDLTRGLKAKGRPIVLTGRVIDADGKPVEGAEVQIWQTDSKGQYNDEQDPQRGRTPLDPNFGYWGRTETGRFGAYRLRTIRPLWYPVIEGEWERPDHIHVAVWVGDKAYVSTQLYFEGDGRLGGDHLYQGLPAAQQEVSVRPVRGRRLRWEGERSRMTDVVEFDIVIDLNSPVEIRRGDLEQIKELARRAYGRGPAQ